MFSHLQSELVTDYMYKLSTIYGLIKDPCNGQLPIGLGPVSRKSRNFSGTFRVTYFSLYLQNEGVSRHEPLQLFLFLFPLQHMRRPALQNKQAGVWWMAFRARKAFGTFEKQAPDCLTDRALHWQFFFHQGSSCCGWLCRHAGCSQEAGWGAR